MNIALLLSLYIPTILLIVLLSTFTLAIIAQSMYWIGMWQIKEYRRDRMMEFLLSPTGRHSVQNIWTISEFCVVIGSIIVYPLLVSQKFQIISLLFFSIFFLCIALRYFRIHFFPQRTVRAFCCIFLTLALATGVCFTLNTLIHFFAAATIVVFLSPIIVALACALSTPVFTILRRRKIFQATKRIRILQPTIIGITGSYGKSTTKEFIFQLLKKHFRVCATPNHVNTDIGIAHVIIDSLQKEHEYFLVEMGAYRRGEIERLCRMTPPIIGVITGLNDQHLALFGSRENIRQAKGELLRVLPSSGCAILNADAPVCMEMAPMTRAHVRYFSTQHPAHVTAHSIVIEPERLTFMLSIRDQRAKVSVPLAGRHLLSPLLAAVAVADYVGMSMREIIHELPRLHTLPGTMYVRQGVRRTTIIDDHYNSNPDGFNAALEYLSVYPSRKIVITSGMIELGDLADTHHRMIGTRIGEIANMIIVTKFDYARPLMESAAQAGMPRQSIITKNVTRFIRDTLIPSLSKNDVILIEGHIAPKLLKILCGTL